MNKNTLVRIIIGTALLIVVLVAISECVNSVNEKREQDKYLKDLIDRTENEMYYEISELNVEIQKAEKNNDIPRLNNLSKEKGNVVTYKLRRISALKLLPKMSESRAWMPKLIPEMPEYNGCYKIVMLLEEGVLKSSDLKYNKCIY